MDVLVLINLVFRSLGFHPQHPYVEDTYTITNYILLVTPTTIWRLLVHHANLLSCLAKPADVRHQAIDWRTSPIYVKIVTLCVPTYVPS
jgi:hypothetical protein